MFSFLNLTTLIAFFSLINIGVYLIRRRKKIRAPASGDILTSELSKTGVAFCFLFGVLCVTSFTLPQFFPELAERFQISSAAFVYCLNVWLWFLMSIVGIFCGLIGFPLQKIRN